ncbi:MAG: hypothetical protein JO256_07820 [Alphaproteobacteria bacterium]|nr:hypothetical protein [Alphaproteobacteria bacterium]
MSIPAEIPLYIGTLCGLALLDWLAPGPLTSTAIASSWVTPEQIRDFDSIYAKGIPLRVALYSITSAPAFFLPLTPGWNDFAAVVAGSIFALAILLSMLRAGIQVWRHSKDGR